MAVHDRTHGDAKHTDKPLEAVVDPKTLDFIERISYFEHLGPVAADNDNASAPSSSKGSACFDSWAMPEFLRG